MVNEGCSTIYSVNHCQFSGQSCSFNASIEDSDDNAIQVLVYSQERRKEQAHLDVASDEPGQRKALVVEVCRIEVADPEEVSPPVDAARFDYHGEVVPDWPIA